MAGRNERNSWGKFKKIDVITLATHVVQKGQAELTQERILNLLFSFRPRRIQLGVGNLAEFKISLVQRALTELEYRRISLLKRRLVTTVQQIFTTVQAAYRRQSGGIRWQMAEFVQL
ncbi:MAG: hypothetical protein ACFFD2_14010 [Promethearchaeota archaeon]